MQLPLRVAGIVFGLCALTAGASLAFEPPVAVDTNPDPNIVEVDLVAEETTWQFVDGINTTVYAYRDVSTGNATIPGPTIKANLGDTVIVNFTNNLPEPTTIHWHGLDLPANMDGSHISQAWVQPGESFRYEFDMPRASLFWYHPHVRTFDQVEKGLYGGVLVSDPVKDAALGLTGLEERILIFDDVLLDANNEIVPAFSFTDPRRNAEYHLNGREGNHLLVNGKWSDEVSLTVENGKPQRWRVLNAANTTFTRLGLEELGVNLWWMGTDGGLLEFSRLRKPIGFLGPVAGDAGPEPLHPTTILIARSQQGIFLLPGERLDVIFTPLGDDGDQFTIWQHDWIRGRHVVIFDEGGGLIVLDDPLDGEYPDQPYMQLVLSGEDPGTGEFVPPNDLQSPINLPTNVAGSLPVTFGHGLPDPAGNVMLFAQADFSSGSMVPLPAPKIDSFNAFDVNVGETWQWEVTNLTHGDHPFHAHGFQFVIDEVQFIDMQNPNGNTTFKWPVKMLKDTVRAPARGGAKGTSKSIVRARMHFDPTGRDIVAQGQLPTFEPDGSWTSGGWLFHCHVLEHSAKGMLSFYEVHDPADPFTLLGKHLAGTGGQYPSLTAEGDPSIPGSSITYNLTDALPNAPAQLILGVEAARTPHKGGEIVPLRQFWVVSTTDANGDVSWNINAWNDVRSGRPIYAQVIVTDPGGPEGRAFSNAVVFTRP